MDKLTKEQLAQADRLYGVFTNHGTMTDKEGSQSNVTIKELKDLITTEDILPLLPRVVTRVIAEAIEPNLLIVPNLFTLLNIPTAQHIEIGAIGALTASKIAQGQEFKSETLAYDVSGQSVAITVSKYGLAVNIAQEVIDDSQFDIITLWLRAAGAALARLKESIGIKLIDTMGITVFDNASPTTSEEGILTGRNIAGTANGTMTLNDLFDMYVYGAQRGYVPDTMLIHPLSWKVFATDSLMKEVVMNGAVLASRRMPLGTFAPGWPAWQGGLGYKLGPTGAEATGASQWTNALNPLGATFNIPAQNILPSPLKVIVSHLIPFQARGTQDPLCNVILADSQRAGVLVQKEDPTTSEADIFSREVHSIHISERYGMAMFDQGKGAWIARNVVAGQNYVFENANAQTLTALPAALTSY
jgi:hypothetical protein